MPVYLTTSLIFALATITEIAGCFAFWAWLRMGQSIWWLAPGIAALIGFAYLLTLIPSDYAGRAYAAYGGIYIVASVLWLWVAEGQRPDQCDMLGIVLGVASAAIILFAPRGA